MSVGAKDVAEDGVVSVEIVVAVGYIECMLRLSGGLVGWM